MQIPDCRNDAYYNEDFLNIIDKAQVIGYDYCTEAAVDSFFDNTDIYFGPESYIGHILNEKLPENMRKEYIVQSDFGTQEETRKIETYADYLRCCLLDYIEGSRDELITTMIDDMDEEEYKKNRRQVFEENQRSENPKVYYDTRKTEFTGKIEPIED